jgi:hypothetical protein
MWTLLLCFSCSTDAHVSLCLCLQNTRAWCRIECTTNKNSPYCVSYHWIKSSAARMKLLKRWHEIGTHLLEEIEALTNDGYFNYFFDPTHIDKTFKIIHLVGTILSFVSPKTMERRTPRIIINDCTTSTQITAFIPPFKRKSVPLHKIQDKTYNTGIKCTDGSTWNDCKPNFEKNPGYIIHEQVLLTI